jgi:HTH-type transcriptional regulator/antitoxin HigA
LIHDYDEKHFVLPEFNILDVLKIKMEEISVKSKDLEPIIGS